MSVLAIYPIAPRSAESEGPDNSKATRRWRIDVSSKLDTEQTIKASGVLPSQYEPLPDNVFMTLRKLSLQHHSESPLSWVATGEYSSAPLSQKEREKQDNPNPLNRSATRRWSTTQYKVPVEKDIEGNAVVNTAGDAYDPPPEKDSSHWSVTITKNVSSVPAFIIDYQDAINDDEIEIGGLTVPAKMAKIQAIEIGDLMEENNVSFYQFSYTIEFNKDTWVLSLLQQGLRQKKSGDATARLPCVDDDDDPVTSPVLLDADGYQLADPQASSGVYVDHDVYEEKDFTVLPGIEDA